MTRSRLLEEIAAHQLVRDTSSNSEKLREICSRIGDNKAPSLGSIPYKVLKLVVKTRTNLFGNIFEACTKERIYPAQWKKPKDEDLLLKPNKLLRHPTSYRPICVSDTLEKMSEKIF